MRYCCAMILFVKPKTFVGGATLTVPREMCGLSEAIIHLPWQEHINEDSRAINAQPLSDQTSIMESQRWCRPINRVNSLIAQWNESSRLGHFPSQDCSRLARECNSGWKKRLRNQFLLISNSQLFFFLHHVSRLSTSCTSQSSRVWATATSQTWNALLIVESKSRAIAVRWQEKRVIFKIMLNKVPINTFSLPRQQLNWPSL